MVYSLLSDYSFDAPYENLERDVTLVSTEIERHLQAHRPVPIIDRLETLNSVFYRNKGAYILGRMCCGNVIVPLAIALRHPSGGIQVDAVLLTDDEVSIVFSFARSYFHVETDDPHQISGFLENPHAPQAHLRAVHIHRVQQAWKNRALSGINGSPGTNSRPIYHRTRGERHGHGRIHHAVFRYGF